MKLSLLQARFDLIATADLSLDYCRHQRITAASTMAAGGLFVSPIRPDGRWFDPDPDGEPALWIDVYERDDDEPVDVAAWLPAAPDRLMTFCGAGTALGMRFAEDTSNYSFGAPLRVFSHPLAWLKDECRGIVPLDSARAARWLIDVRPPALQVDDWRAGSALKRAIAAVTTLRIVVPPTDRRAA